MQVALVLPALETFLSISILLLAETVGGNVGHRGIEPSNCLIWGPGLRSDFVVPARYFFIQAVDSTGNNITESPGEDAFSVHISQRDSGRRSRVWLQILDRHDGSFIVRFKLFDSYENLHIRIMHGNQDVAQSPYLLEGPVYHEKCHCPETDLATWLETMQCPSGYRQIKQDLSIFNEINFHVVKKEAIDRFNSKGRHALCHYVIKDNQIYRKTYGEHVGFKMFMDAILLSLTRKVYLPDVEFFVNLGDWPLEKRKSNEKPIPMFSWCGSDDTSDIIMPTYDVTESTLQTMGRCDKESQSIEMPTYQISEEDLKNSCRVTLDLLSVQANTGPKWENKSSVAFWRGRDSRQERLDLVKLSRKNPDLIDAKLTNMFFFKHSEELGELVKHVSFFDFFKYKYQLNIDGTVAAYRFPYLLAGDSLVLKQDSIYYEHFYKDLKPFVHYIPLKKDLSDLIDQLQWAMDHDQEAYRIAQNGRKFVQDHLMSRDIFCYHTLLFQAYSKKLISKVTVEEDMELVKEEKEEACACKRNIVKKDEL